MEESQSRRVLRGHRPVRLGNYPALVRRERPQRDRTDQLLKNLKPCPTCLCDTPGPRELTPNSVAKRGLALEEQHDAQVCHEANQSLNSAQGVQAIDAAIARVRALCHK